MTCGPCEVARRAAEDVLELRLDIDSVRVHQIEAGADAIGGVWDHVWSAVDDEAAALLPVELARRLARLPDAMSALDRHAVESEPAMATADDLLRGAVVRSCVDAFVTSWVLAHGSAELTPQSTIGCE